MTEVTPEVTKSKFLDYFKARSGAYVGSSANWLPRFMAKFHGKMPNLWQHFRKKPLCGRFYGKPKMTWTTEIMDLRATATFFGDP